MFDGVLSIITNWYSPVVHSGTPSVVLIVSVAVLNTVCMLPCVWCAVGV